MALVPIVAINTYVGYRIANIKTREKEKESITHIVQVDEHMSYKTMTDNSDNNNFLDKHEELHGLEKLHQEFVSSNLELETVLRNSDKDSEIYISALYEKAKRNGISDENLKRELHNILVYSLLYTDMSDDEWMALFGNLQSTLSRDINPLEYYYPLASYVHRSECNLEHTRDDIDDKNIVCDSLMEEVTKIQNDWYYLGYLYEMVCESHDQEVIDSFDKLCNSSIDIMEAIDEVKLMYPYMQVPRCMSEEEIMQFKTLLSTVGERDNIFMVYRKLAIFIHTLDCDYEHYVDEYDIHKCKGLEKK